MIPKSPKKLRQDLEAARRRLETLIGILNSNSAEKQWELGSECKKASESLCQLLQENEIPQAYNVAVVGRFKVGKSSFVNEMLGRKLASEDTNPETAAVTTFTYGERVRAKIKFVEKSVWDALKALYSKDSSDPEAHRVANWMKFSGKDRSGQSGGLLQATDLAALEREYVRDSGYTLSVPAGSNLDPKEQRKEENDFRRRIKEYTSSSRPHHCLVESIEIETPSPILGEGVTLIDTPGLDDTERFRVQLTERAVQNVDAVLFLTKSGAAYGQSEKDFLLSMLRKGTVKQVIFVVTQVDHTYDQHVRQTREQDEEPQQISERIEAERRRIKTEIESTLDEIGAEASNSVQRYREQLGAIEIAFTSAANHRDWMSKETVKFPIAKDDPGGMNQVRETLFKVLSVESRLAEARQSFQKGTDTILQNMMSVVETRRSVVRGLKNREVAETKLGTFRDEFQQNCKEFKNLIDMDCVVLKDSLKNKGLIQRLSVENIVLQADKVLSSYETDDAGSHWRTRRGGSWGYMTALQSRVANKIFPRVSEQLNAQTEEFTDFIEKFRVHLRTLSDSSEAIIKRLEIGEDFQLNMTESLDKFLQESLDSLQALVAGEEDRIVALLGNFADEEVEEKISQARSAVSGIWGKGTTATQTSEVRAFYKEVSRILRNALSDHVLGRFKEYSEHLVSQSESLPKRALSEVKVQIKRASTDIRSAAEAAIAGQKDAFDRTAEVLIRGVSDAQGDISSLLEADGNYAPPSTQTIPNTTAESPHPLIEPTQPTVESAQPPVRATIGSFTEIRTDLSPDTIRERATKCIARLTLRNGETGWPFSKIVPKDYITAATEAWLTDPYLAAPHQRRNLREFIDAVMSSAKLKTLNILTSLEGPVSPEDRQFFDRLDQGIYEQMGTRVYLSRTPDVHDRFATFNNGVVLKLGRGLDIYKPATGLASVNPALRRVRECEIDVFVWSEP